ncbi:MAG: hypothetical protein FD140_4385 [Limisphaerales bacterium]|nr:MAG: hypothetical protein FD140_4385 [Limisphaerales bacterium]
MINTVGDRRLWVRASSWARLSEAPVGPGGWVLLDAAMATNDDAWVELGYSILTHWSVLLPGLPLRLGDQNLLHPGLKFRQPKRLAQIVRPQRGTSRLGC